MKQLVIIALVAVGGFLAWQNFPGLRTAAQSKLNQLQSWSSEDREKDPAGFIDYAKSQLTDNIKKFESLVEKTDEDKTKNEAKLNEFLEKHQRGQDWIAEAKTVFRQQDAGGTWPLTFRGREYANEEDFLNQVTVIRNETVSANERAEEYRALVDSAHAQRTNYQMKVQDMGQAIAKLDSQKSQIESASRTDASEKVLADVAELVDGTSKQASGDLLSLDELTQLEDKAKAVEEAVEQKDFQKQENRDFLLNG